MTDNTMEKFSTMDVSDTERAALEAEIATQYTRDGNNYHDIKKPDIVAFKDEGDKLSTVFRSNKVANAMTLLAASKGWQVYKTHGHKQFFNAVEKTSEQLTERLDNGISTPNVSKTDDNQLDAEKIAELTDEQVVKNAAALKALQEQYRVAGSKYFFKDQIGRTSTIAFNDKGEKLATSVNTERVTKSMVELAAAKGWQAIKVSGHKDFRRQAWREAIERGIEVKGYTPTAEEQAELDARKPQNTISNENVPERGKDTKTAQQATTDESGKRYSGVLMAQGAANYKHEPDASKSYYATVKTDNAEPTIWDSRDIQ